MIKRYKLVATGTDDIKVGEVLFAARLREDAEGSWCWHGDIVSLQAQLAEAQADNAALSGFIEDLYEDIRFWNRGTYDSEDICNSINNNMEKPTFQQPHPGASLLAELKELREGKLIYQTKGDKQNGDRGIG